MGVCTSAGKDSGNRQTSQLISASLRSTIKDMFDLSDKDIKKIQGVVEQYDYEPRVLYKDYINKYNQFKKINDTYDEATKTIKYKAPSAAIKYLFDNMPSDYNKQYMSNGELHTKMADDYKKYSLTNMNKDIHTYNRDEASKILYSALNNSVTVGHGYKDGKPKQIIRTRLPKNSPKFMREAGAIILVEYINKKIMK